jgi:hypothetical protein
VRVAVEGVLDDADLGALGEELIVDYETARLDVAGQVVGNRGEDAHGFVDAGLEVGAGIEGWAETDLEYAGEGGADFGCQALEG